MGGRKHKHPEHENHERWLVSYADFITLLFATFTALYAIATADLAKLSKVQETAEAISQSFQEQSLVSGIKSIMKGKSPPNANPDPLSKKVGEGPGLLGKHDSLVPKKGTVHNKKPTVQELNAMMDQVNKQLKSLAGASLSMDKTGARITFDSTLLFDSGNSNLKPRAQQAITLIAQRLTEVSNTHHIVIEGHTDNQPIHSLFYPSNWELSAARACSVVRLLQTRVKHIPANALSAVGYGDTRPKATNSTLAGRAQNRRIDIFIQGFTPVSEPDTPVTKLQPMDKPLEKSQKASQEQFPEKRGAHKPNDEHDQKPLEKPVASSHASHKPTDMPTDSPARDAPHKPVAHLKTVVKPSPMPPAQKSHAPDGFVPPRFEPITTTKSSSRN